MSPKSLSEEELQTQLLDPQQCRSAFEAAVRMYSTRIYWLVRRIVQIHEEADDIVQEVFIKAWENLSNFRGEAKFYTWLYRIAVYAAINHNKRLRQMQKNVVGLNEEGEELLNQLTADPYFDGDLGEQKLSEAIALLPSRQRMVFEMRYFDERPYKEIAEITQTSEETLRAAYHHAVRKVTEYISTLD